MDSGGRFTENTNDLSLAYARAQRDLSCAYTVGFYHDGLSEDEIEDISIYVRKPGLRVVYPGKYVVRSEPVRRESMLRAAWFAPSAFDTGIVQAHAFPIRPATRTEWDALLAISFPIPRKALAERDQAREYGAVLRDGSRVVDRFARRLFVLPANTDPEGVLRVTMIEPATLPPGQYELTVVLSDPDVSRPDAVKVAVTVPEIPRRELFFVGPMLAQTTGANLTVFGESAASARIGAPRSFEPLLVLQHSSGSDLLALTQACMVGKRKVPADARIHRRLTSGDGQEIGLLEPVALELSDEGKIRCQNLLDVVPAGSLSEGEYVLEAALGQTEKAPLATERVRFAVTPPPD